MLWANAFTADRIPLGALLHLPATAAGPCCLPHLPAASACPICLPQLQLCVCAWFLHEIPALLVHAPQGTFVCNLHTLSLCLFPPLSSPSVFPFLFLSLPPSPPLSGTLICPNPGYSNGFQSARSSKLAAKSQQLHVACTRRYPVSLIINYSCVFSRK